MIDKPRRYSSSTLGYLRYIETSDPKLVNRLGSIPEITAEEEAKVRAQILRAYPTESPADVTARAEVEAMLFAAPTEGLVAA